MGDGERSAKEREAARREREAARRARIGVFNEPELDPPQATASDEPFTEWEEPRPGDLYDVEDADTEAVAPERPSGTRRISHRERRDSARGQTRPVRRPRAPQRARRRHSWRGRIGSLLALIRAGALIWILVELFQPFGTSPHGNVTVVIPPHSSTKQIAALLQRDGVISRSFFFELRATLGGERGDLRAGTYHLHQGMTYSAVLAALTKVPKAAPTTQLTLSEGHTRQYVGALLRRAGIGGNYVAATRHSRLLDPHRYGAPRNVASLEGFLFPDTFTLVKPVRLSTLIADQLKDFKRRFAQINLGYARSRHLTPYDVLTIASLIEGEAATAKDRPLVASVIYNRLADHMLLQLDSTTRYATGNFTQDLTSSQLHSRSPYNTRTRPGLPPTPIDSPGMAAIDAAAHPAHTNYHFFFTKPCTNKTVFTVTYPQFETLLARDRRLHCH